LIDAPIEALLAYRKALVRELERLRELERIAIDFCARCHLGSVRSSYTYRRFRAVLAPDAGATPGVTCHAMGDSGR